jgi:hypothetical protein
MLIYKKLTFLGQEVIRMNTCTVFQPQHAGSGDQVGIFDFSGNKPALPPLTTEAVATVIYLVDEESKK